MDETLVGVFFSKEILSIKKGETKDILVTLKNHQLSKGQYYFDFSVGTGNEITGITEYDNVSKVIFFEITYQDKDKQQMITLWPSDWGNISFQNVSINQLH